MTKNQQGFTYPLTLAILMAFLIFFSIQVEQLLVERKMFHETKIIYKQEYYMLASVKKIEQRLQSGEALPAYGRYTYIYGAMDYQIEAPAGNLQKVNFNLQLASGETAQGFGYYDLNLQKFTKWVEKN